MFHKYILPFIGCLCVLGCGNASQPVEETPTGPDVQSFMTQYGYVDITCDEDNTCTGVYRDSGQPVTDLMVQGLLEQLIVTNEEVIEEALKDCAGKTVGIYANLKSGMPDETKYADWCMPTSDYSEMCGPEGCVTTGGYKCPNSDELVQYEQANAYNIESYKKFHQKQLEATLETFKKLYADHPEMMSQEEYESRVAFYEAMDVYGLNFVMNVCDYPKFIEEFGDYFRQIDIPGKIETIVEYPACDSPIDYEVIIVVQNLSNGEYNWKKQTAIPIHSEEEFENWLDAAMLHDNYMWPLTDSGMNKLKQAVDQTDFSKDELVVLEGGSQPAETFYITVNNACGNEIIYNVEECLNTGHGAGIGYPFMIIRLPKGEYTFTGGFRQVNCSWDGEDGVIQYPFK
ncbi:MAG: hypothetical protein IKY83_13695 [Proteobacteria bacterium]|nr:hypothetical protein [Pseudomonadota bacterium]